MYVQKKEISKNRSYSICCLWVKSCVRVCVCRISRRRSTPITMCSRAWTATSWGWWRLWEVPRRPCSCSRGWMTWTTAGTISRPNRPTYGQHARNIERRFIIRNTQQLKRVRTSTHAVRCCHMTTDTQYRQDEGREENVFKRGTVRRKNRERDSGGERTDVDEVCVWKRGPGCFII